MNEENTWDVLLFGLSNNSVSVQAYDDYLSTLTCVNTTKFASSEYVDLKISVSAFVPSFYARPHASANQQPSPWQLVCSPNYNAIVKPHGRGNFRVGVYASACNTPFYSTFFGLQFNITQGIFFL